MGTEFVRRTLPANVNALQECFAFVREGARRSGLSEEDMDRLDLIMEEFFMNVARHAYPAGQSGDIELGYAVPATGTLQVEISDSGKMFNPLASSPPDFSRGLVERPLGGMGIFLVNEMAGGLTYRWLDNRNTISFNYPKPESNGS
jgi:anti-sigma regulatory factor (Ser/Thr protein kinase)